MRRALLLVPQPLRLALRIDTVLATGPAFDTVIQTTHQAGAVVEKAVTTNRTMWLCHPRRLHMPTQQKKCRQSCEFARRQIFL